MRKVIGVVASGLALACFAPTASAGGGNFDFTATFKTDANATMTFSVGLDRKGEPTRLSQIVYDNVDLVCPDGTRTETSGTMRGSRRIYSTGDGRPSLLGGGADSKAVKVFNGLLSPSDERSRGFIAIWGHDGPANTCATGQGDGLHTKVHWTAISGTGSTGP
jgi:hypothetical protein